MNDPEVAEQTRAIVPHLPKVLLNLYETLGGQESPRKMMKVEEEFSWKKWEDNEQSKAGMRQWPSELILVSFRWLVCAKLTEHPYFTRSKVRASMTSNTETVVNPVDTPVDSMTRESTTVEENRTLRHVMTQLWQAWANGQEPPTYIPGFLRSLVPISYPFFPPEYGPFDNCGVGPSTICPQGMSFRNNPTVVTAAPFYTLSQPTVMQRATQEG
ncbi:hypothetical protein KY289_030199 [Solanum tuberosum]|nr:hypothetical protein KY289_030199 [Solanum tuberosum]